MNSNKITKELIFNLTKRGHLYAMGHLYIGHYECDVFSLTTKGYTVEYEVKISRTDFFQDFTKTPFKNSKWARFSNKTRDTKHIEIQLGKRTNRFFFVTPIGLIKEHEIPTYAGWIEVEKKFRYIDQPHYVFHNRKPAPLLHKKTIELKRHDLFQDIARKCYERYANIKGR